MLLRRRCAASPAAKKRPLRMLRRGTLGERFASVSLISLPFFLFLISLSITPHEAGRPRDSTFVFLRK